MRYIVSCMVVLALAGCGDRSPGFLKKLRKAPAQEATAPVGQPIDLLAGTEAEPVEGAPKSDGDPFDGTIETAAVKPAENATTVEELDTTTAEERREAIVEQPASDDGRIGTTIASLGAPGEPGFWIKTPLVTEERSGRLVYVGSGRSVQVKLLPSGGPAGGGSQVSLAAMRLLDAPLAGLPELVVYSN